MGLHTRRLTTSCKKKNSASYEVETSQRHNWFLIFHIFFLLVSFHMDSGIKSSGTYYCAAYNPGTRNQNGHYKWLVWPARHKLDIRSQLLQSLAELISWVTTALPCFNVHTHPSAPSFRQALEKYVQWFCNNIIVLTCWIIILGCICVKRIPTNHNGCCIAFGCCPQRMSHPQFSRSLQARVGSHSMSSSL